MKTDFILRCAACGLFLSDATPHFEIVAVTIKPKCALVFPDGEAAELARKFLHSIYPSFDWRAVERDLYTTEKQHEVWLQVPGLRVA